MGRRRLGWSVTILLAGCLGGEWSVSAQAPPPPAAASEIQGVRDELSQLRTEFDGLRRDYEQRLLQLEERLRQLESSSSSAGASEGAAATAAQEPAPPPPPPSPQPPPVIQAAPATTNVFNPDTSMIGNFVGAAGTNPLGEEPSLQLSEAELSFQAAVDPFARAALYLAASPEGVEIEEGYVTFTTLPANLLLKVGKLRAQFGKMNTLHTHALPTADRPLVTQNLVGGEEGLSDGGFSLSHLINNPFLFLEATGEVFRGDSDVFQSQERSDLNYVGRLRAYRDLTESTNLDFGVSYAYGPAEVDLDLPDPVSEGKTFHKDLIGFDATFRYRPLRRAIYRRLNLRTELVWSRQETPADVRAKAFGFYGLAEYQFARRWYIGARVDRSGRTFDPSLVDEGGSVFLTFWPSEFSQIRGQYRRTNYAEGVEADEFLFQFNFAIGAHGAHVF